MARRALSSSAAAVRVAIIGGGPAGLTACKAALDEGLDPVVFEASSHIGGLWRPRSAGGVMWKSMRTNVSRATCSFSDFPWPAVDDNDNDNAGLFPRASSVCSYLQAYADSFGVTGRVRLGCRVTAAELVDDGSRKWDLQWTTTSREGEEEDKTFDARTPGQHERFDFLVVASGVFCEPQGLPALEDGFSGQVLHSSQYFDPDLFRDKRVLVVGGSFSGAEICADLAGAAASVTSSSRRRFWYLPRVLAGSGLPVDAALFMRSPDDTAAGQTQQQQEQQQQEEQIETKAPSIHGWTAKHAYLQDLAQNHCLGEDLQEALTPRTADSAGGSGGSGGSSGAGDGAPDPPAVVISDRFPDLVRDGTVRCVGPVTGAHGQRVSFDGAAAAARTDDADTHHVGDDFDVAILATGFKTALSFLHPSVQRAVAYDPNDQLQPTLLHRDVFCRDYPTLAFVGVYRGPFFAIMELQARWACGVFSGRLERPGDDDIAAGQAAAARIRNRRPRPQFPSELGYAETADGLAKLVGCWPGRTLATADDATAGNPLLWRAVREGPVLPAQFRLEGHGASPELAEQAIAAYAPVFARPEEGTGRRSSNDDGRRSS